MTFNVTHLRRSQTRQLTTVCQSGNKIVRCNVSSSEPCGGIKNVFIENIMWLILVTKYINNKLECHYKPWVQINRHKDGLQFHENYRYSSGMCDIIIIINLRFMGSRCQKLFISAEEMSWRVLKYQLKSLRDNNYW